MRVGRTGKPYPKQDQIGEKSCSDSLLLPGRSLEVSRERDPRGMTAGPLSPTELGLLTASEFFVYEDLIDFEEPR